MAESFPLRQVLLTIIILTTTHLSAHSQGPAVITQPVEWFALTPTVKFHKRLTLFLDGQFRFVSAFQPMQFQFRTGLDVKLTDHLFVMPLGYGYSWNFQYGKQPAAYMNNEHRIWQQVLIKHNLGRVIFFHRFRSEQRYLQAHTKDATGETVNEGYITFINRLRYRLALNIPMNHPTMEPATYYAAFYDEIFYDWGKSISYRGLDQNRLFAGAGYQATKEFSFQIGFLFQTLLKSNATLEENNLGFQLQLFYNVDVTKKDN